MSAAQPKPTEPSMEEILASIRRIISDDQTKAPVVAAAAPPVATQPAPAPVPPVTAAPAQTMRAPVSHDDDDDVLDLMPKAAAKEPRQKEPHFITDDPVSNDLSFEDPVPVAPVQAPSKGQDDIDALMAAAEFAPTPMPPPPAPLESQIERLVSPVTDRMVTTAFSSLANTVLTNNARTLEDLMQDVMRPMIRSWLDDNLPNIVERLVRAEIERVSRGGR
ncbi:MAG: PopZ family protein [Beijerinckiaceae bacterium]